jgi:predicted nuclease of predicted toxin-antitoxin system
MPRCVADVHVPLALVKALRRTGIDARTAHETGLGSAADVEIAAYALREKCWILTNDSDFLDAARAASLSRQMYPSVLAATIRAPGGISRVRDSPVTERLSRF